MNPCRLFTSWKVFLLAVCLTSSGMAQTAPPHGDGAPPRRDVALEKAILLGELQSLARETQRFDHPLAEAAAKAEIADAGWPLDQAWAKELLRAAYAHVLPGGDELERLKRPAGSRPPPPDNASRSRLQVRLRVLEVARRDAAFVNELMKTETESSGAFGEHYAASALADQALTEGDVSAGADYVLRGIRADPTQGASVELINRIALRDRAEADRLALLYISELRRFPLSPANQSDIRTFGILSSLANATVSHDPGASIPPPGPAVMRAYVSYMLEALDALEQAAPGYLRGRRANLLGLWVPLQQHAPELTGAFLNLEGRSRRPGQNLALPTAARIAEERRSRYEQSLAGALGSDRPDEGVIFNAISRGDFDKARKLISKLPDEARRKSLTEAANAAEAVSLTTKGNIYVAEEIARELRLLASMRAVYPLLIRASLARKDKPRATRLVSHALQQVKDADTSPPASPAGIPAAAVASDQRFDPSLSFIAELAMALQRDHAGLAFEVLSQLVSASNAAHAEAERARIGFDVRVFRVLAPRDESQVRQAAYSVRNPVTRVLALAAFYQWKVQDVVAGQVEPRR